MFAGARTLGQWCLFAVFAVVLYFCLRIIQPFLMPIVLALILWTLLAPVYERLAARLGNRTGTAALLVCASLTVAIALPALFLSISLAREANDTYQQLRDPETAKKISFWLDPGTNPVLSRIQSWLPAGWRLENLELSAQLGSQAQRVGVVVLGVATAVAAGAFNFLVEYFIMLVVLFFLLRDSAYFAEAVRKLSPLSEKEENHFVETFRQVSRATVLGTLLTAIAQGTISGIIFLALGLPSPILWGALTTLLSLVPVVGTALVWVPWTIYLFATGYTVKAVIFLATQVLIVGGIDNVLRPLLMRGHIRMHTLVVFFSILGGVGYFGILGMFLGPLVFAIAVAFFEFYTEE
jgi:predicted PurR-regulated permease PerM